MSYKHLGIDERIYIENQLKFKFKISEIAKNLNRSISTIIREINRNKENNHYFSLIAQNKAENRKQSHISFHKFKNKNLVKYVQQKLLLGWSPEQIYGRIKNFHKEWVISFKTIYTWIYFGMLDKVTSKNLRRKGKKRKSKENRGKFNGKSIKERDINVSGKEILTDKIIGNKRYLFNYNHAPNRETIIQNLGFVAERQYKNNFAKLEVQELKNYLLLQNELIKLSPQLTPKFKIKDIDKANNFLGAYRCCQ
ncbi:IS30 family transposase [Spiroplasma endosymbiont of Nomada ruficornis]|uniref:IS30 family transposase n=1 Tax=Spiroplasma endosymbiont of Nomada ruficornis TaxID=3066325 RepID=UPI00313CD742